MSQQDWSMKKELDLRDIIAVLIKHKVILIGSILISLLVGIIYCSLAKKIYIGKGLVEIGEIVFKDSKLEKPAMVIQPLEQVGDLAELVSHVSYKDTMEDGNLLQIELVRGSSKLLSIKYENENPEVIKGKIQANIRLILDRHKDKMDFYNKAGASTRASKSIGEIVVSSHSIKPNTRSIIVGTALAGFILGLVLIFVIEFVPASISSKKK